MAQKPYTLKDKILEFLFNQLFYHIDTRNIENDAITNDKIATDAVNSVSIAESAVTHTERSELACFLARPTASQTNIAINTAVTVVFGTEIFDVGGQFATNTFTATVTGHYMFNVHLRLEALDSAANYYQAKLVTSNRSYPITIDPGQFAGDLDYYPMTFSVVADMDINDTAHITIEQNGGTQQTDVHTDSWFSGKMLK